MNKNRNKDTLLKLYNLIDAFLCINFKDFYPNHKIQTFESCLFSFLALFIAIAWLKNERKKRRGLRNLIKLIAFVHVSTIDHKHT